LSQSRVDFSTLHKLVVSPLAKNQFLSGEKMAVTIKPIELSNKTDIETFLSIPWKIYIQNGKKDPNWVPPFLDDQRSLLDPKKNPFHEHAKIQLFIAFNEKNEPAGRIGASVDDNFVNFHNEKIGFFGWYESINDLEVAKALYNSAAAFIKSHGMTAMRGPASFTSNDDYFGFLLEGFDSPARIAMTYNPPYYLELAEKSGNVKAKDLYAWYLSAEIPLPERIVKIAERTMKREKITVRPLDMKNFERDTNIVRELYNKIWEKNWGFVPLTEAEFQYQAKKLKDIIWADFIHIAEVDGKAIGFNLVVKDVNQALIKMDGELFKWSDPFALIKFLFCKFDDTREMAMGVHPDYRKKGLEAILYLEALKTGKKRKVKGGELSWTLEDNVGINNGIEAMGGKIIKKYRVYEKALS
jgi:GNAT superfamily N-acetyltransferase